MSERGEGERDGERRARAREIERKRERERERERGGEGDNYRHLEGDVVPYIQATCDHPCCVMCIECSFSTSSRYPRSPITRPCCTYASSLHCRRVYLDLFSGL